MGFLLGLLGLLKFGFVEAFVLFFFFFWDFVAAQNVWGGGVC